ncbi:MAG TPA: T9SS type A sorting domain-containing protein [Bacteroidia bacterium]|nr:T9SS type A sorting domain-containing protein [Bacteroidia bacterium]
MRKLFFLFFILCSLKNVAQINKFEVVDGGINYNYGQSVQQTFDGGYIVTGATSSIGNGSTDVYLFKLDSLGNVKWQKTYGSTNVDMGFSVHQTQDSGFIIAGYTNSFGAGGYDFYLIKTDSIGNLQWTKTYGGTDWDFAYSVKQTTDGGYVIVGGTYSYGKGNEDVYLIKTNATGDTLWTKTYGGSGQDEGRSVWQNTDGGYFITGFTNSFGAGGLDAYLIRTNSLGDTLWTKTVGDTLDQALYSGQQTSDGSFISVGYTNTHLNGKDIYIIRSNNNGDTLWTTTRGGTSDDVGYSIIQTPDGNFACFGYTESFGQGMKDYVFYKVASGNYFLNSRTYGGIYDDIGYCINNTKDHGFIMTGQTASYGNGPQNIYTIKTDSNGTATGIILVGVNENGIVSKNNILAYPNPCSNYCRLTFNYIASEKNISITLYNTLGEEIEQVNPSILPDSNGLANVTVATTNLPSGIYLVKISNGNFIETQKIIVQH